VTFSSRLLMPLTALAFSNDLDSTKKKDFGESSIP
jgi:hypothetical protein